MSENCENFKLYFAILLLMHQNNDTMKRLNANT